MNLGWKEIKHSKGKYVLIEGILLLMVFMVLFLSGLANGLARAVSASIETAEAPYFILSEDAEKLITISSIDSDILDEITEMTSNEIAPFNLQRMNLNRIDDSTKLDVTYFAIGEDSFLNPTIIQGEGLTVGKNEIILDQSFKEYGITIGEVVEDSSTGIELTVVGFTKDAYYGHTSVGYISLDTYQQIRRELNPMYEASYHAVAVNGADVKNISIKGYEVVSKDNVVENIPGYKAEQTTIQMILWVLVVVSAAILGVFFYVITIQKEKQFGVLKAIGMPMRKIVGLIVSQVMMLAGFSVVIGNVLTWAMSKMLPASMPFYLNGKHAILVSVAFLVVSFGCSLISTAKVAKVDPMISIGGKE